MKIVLATDHNGFRLKEEIKSWLKTEGYIIEDVGVYSEEGGDYPLLALEGAKIVLSDTSNRGIFFCAGGNGMAIAANKVAGIRSINAHSASEIKRARRDGDVNVLALATNSLTEEVSRSIIESFLGSAYEANERRERRLGQLLEIEKSN